MINEDDLKMLEFEVSVERTEEFMFFQMLSAYHTYRNQMLSYGQPTTDIDREIQRLTQEHELKNKNKIITNILNDL